MKIHIVGASGSGVTTLGQLLSAEINSPYFDTDDYFWEKTNPPYTVARSQEQRNGLLQYHLLSNEHCIVGGSMIDWGEEFISVFDLVIFLWIPKDLRILRLKHREFERYGKIIFLDPVRRKKYKEFIDWASGYDDNMAKGRTLWAHERWLSKLPCPVLELRGDMTIDERMSIIIKEINKIGDYPQVDSHRF